MGLSKQRSKQRRIIDALLLIVLTFFFLYSLWYQFAYSPIEIAFPLLGGLLLILSLGNIRISLHYYRPLFPVAAFICVAAVTGVLFPLDREITRAQLIKVVEYTIPMFAIYAYVDGELKKFYKVLWMLTFSVTLLAIYAIVFGHSSSSGGIVLGELNANAESSFLAIAVTADIILLVADNPKLIKKIFLLVSAALCAKAQIDCASRRGFVLLVFLIVVGLFSAIQIKYKGKTIVKAFMFITVACAAAVVVTAIADVLKTSVLFQRFSAGTNEGDRLRKVYQAKAWLIFLSNPIAGGGFGSVEYVAGMYSHSFYVELLACTGVVGFLIMMGMLIKSAVFFLKRTFGENNIEMLIVARGMLLLVITILVGGIAVVYIYDMYFYIMLGLVFSVNKILLQASDVQGEM